MSEAMGTVVGIGFALQFATNVAVWMKLRQIEADRKRDSARIYGLEVSVYGLPRSAPRVAEP
jgi:hypothetical protein